MIEQMNTLEPELRDNRVWNYVMLGENTVKSWRDKNATVTDLLEFPRVRPSEPVGQQRLDLQSSRAI